MSDLVTAFGLMLVIEGALYALFPGPMRKMAARMLEEPEGPLRTAGLLAALTGFGVVWLVRAG